MSEVFFVVYRLYKEFIGEKKNSYFFYKKYDSLKNIKEIHFEKYYIKISLL